MSEWIVAALHAPRKTDHSILKIEAPAPWTQQPGRKSEEMFCDEHL